MDLIYEDTIRLKIEAKKPLTDEQVVLVGDTAMKLVSVAEVILVREIGHLLRNLPVVITTTAGDENG